MYALIVIVDNKF